MKYKTYKQLRIKQTQFEKRHPKRAFNLRMFDEDPSGSDDGDKSDEGGKPKDSDKDPAEKKYNDADVDRIVAKHKAEWEKKHADEIKKATDEARKYERMSKEQRDEADKKKAAEESAQKDARIKELEAKIAMDDLRKTVAADVEAMEEGITASQDFLDLVVTGDADASKANVKKLVGIILADRKAQEEKRARGNTPKNFGNNGDTLTEIERRIAKYKK